MRIAVWHNLPSGGGKRALYDHIRGLLSRGHEVEAWCPESADQTYLPLDKLIKEHAFPLERPARRLRGRLGWLLRPYYDVVDLLSTMDKHGQRCAKEINAGRFDVLFANTCVFFRTPFLGRYVEIPKVLYLQEPYRWLYEALPRLPWLAPPRVESIWRKPRRLWRALADIVRVQGLRIQAREELINAMSFDRILVNSLFSRESLLRAYGVDAKVCYLGIDDKFLVDGERERQDIVVGLGSVCPEKNVTLAIQAIATLSDPRPTLLWVGNAADSTHEQELRKLAASLQVPFEIKIRVTDQELVDTLRRAVAFIYTPRLEPFGLAPLEANACGTPVVAVAEGGVRETILDGVNGLIVEHDARQVGAAINRLRCDPDLARRLSENATRVVAQKWRLAHAVDRLEAALKETVSQQRKCIP
jgi:glycosyltransferase involved in cell wall biosynthesis